jgi:osmoprotectant transport system substrate-binding protein
VLFARITLTSKNFTEQLILGKIAVIAAKAAGFDVTDMTNIPDITELRARRGWWAPTWFT